MHNLLFDLRQFHQINAYSHNTWFVVFMSPGPIDPHVSLCHHFASVVVCRHRRTLFQESSTLNHWVTYLQKLTSNVTYGILFRNCATHAFRLQKIHQWRSNKKIRGLLKFEVEEHWWPKIPTAKVIKCFAERSLIRTHRSNPEQLGQIWTQYPSLILSEFGLWSNLT